MVTCPNGHPNPPGWELCGECGATIDAVEPPMSGWSQTKWAIVGMSLAAVLAIPGGAAAFLVTRGGESSSPAPTPSGSVAIRPGSPTCRVIMRRARTGWVRIGRTGNGRRSHLEGPVAWR